MKIFEQVQILQNLMNAFVQNCANGNIDQSKLQGINATLSAITNLNNSRETLLYGGV